MEVQQQGSASNVITGAATTAGLGVVGVGAKQILDEVSKNNTAVKLATEKLSEGDYVKFTFKQLGKEAKEAKKPFLEFVKDKLKIEFKSVQEVKEHIKKGYESFIKGVMSKTDEQIKTAQAGKIGFIETIKKHFSSKESIKAFWNTIKKPAGIAAGVAAVLFLFGRAIHKPQEEY